MGANTVCGTDVGIPRRKKTKGISRRTILGHELAGYVVEVGRNVGNYEEDGSGAVAAVIPC